MIFLTQNTQIFDIQAESGIVATLIYNPKFIIHSENLKPEHFYNKETACVYWAIRELIKQGVENIDAFNLEAMINNDDKIKSIFSQYKIDLNEYIELSKYIVRNTIEEYKLLVNKVLSLSFKRELYKKLKYYENLCLDFNKEDITELSAQIYNDLNKLNEQYVLNDNIKLFGEKIEEIWNKICSQRNTDGTFGIETKSKLLNEYFTYQPGELVVFEARMKQGKSAFLISEAIHLLEKNYAVAYLDTEMSDQLILERILAALTKIPVKKIRAGNYSPSEEELLKSAIEWLKTRRFVHIYQPVWTNEKIYSTAKVLQYKMGMNFLIFDYLKSNSGSANDIYNQLGEKCDFLKNQIAGDLNIPVLTAAQLNRHGEVADSDKIDRYASVSLVWKKKDEEEMPNDWKTYGNYYLRVKYNRLGESMDEDDYIDFVFDGSTMQIYEAPIQHKKLDCPV